MVVVAPPAVFDTTALRRLARTFFLVLENGVVVIVAVLEPLLKRGGVVQAVLSLFPSTCRTLAGR